MDDLMHIFTGSTCQVLLSVLEEMKILVEYSIPINHSAAALAQYVCHCHCGDTSRPQLLHVESDDILGVGRVLAKSASAMPEVVPTIWEESAREVRQITLTQKWTYIRT